MDLSFFPPLNASLNATAGICLVFGWRAIKSKNRRLHIKWMTAALAASSLFLICYLTYHGLKHGAVTRYEGEGAIRALYFFILLTHTPLAAAIVPFCLMAVWHAIKGRYEKHVRITCWLLPTWLYVSVTGVLIYLMLYVF